MSIISDSVLDIFKIGPGPSSSHTIGPMRMGADFRRRFPGAREIAIDFYGSMALTGRGHGSDRAAVAGLIGQMPETCDIALLNGIRLDRDNRCRVGEYRIAFRFHTGDNPYRHANTVAISSGAARMVYYSVGGGFIEIEGEAPASPLPPGELPPCRYRDGATFLAMLDKYALDLPEALRRNECFRSGGRSPDEALSRRIAVMLDAVERGLHTSGKLPGALGVSRRAPQTYQAARERERENMLFLDAYALAAAEENAAGHLVVTAPTSGSAGLIPGLLYFLKHHEKLSEELLRDGLLAAGLIGLVARHNASIAGAEVGCQGEIGVASAMGAALLAQAHKAAPRTVLCAAEIALEHHLGLSCDPVGGYVQIPCIERNAAGAVAACNAWLLASAGSSSTSLVGFDEVLAAMLETGRAMARAYKETSLGGLARCACCI